LAAVLTAGDHTKIGAIQTRRTHTHQNLIGCWDGLWRLSNVKSFIR
jgi:hypothetical protein